MNRLFSISFGLMWLKNLTVARRRDAFAMALLALAKSGF
jgi:hypothetical protein